MDWERFHTGERRRRVPLPTYPFERQRYWIDRGDLWQTATQRATPEKKADLAGWFYVPGWQEAPLASAAAPAERRTWLLFADECGVADALAEGLAADGQDVLRVAPGERFAQTGPRSFTLDPRLPEDYDRLLQAARDQGLPPAAIVHAWSVTADPTAAASIEPNNTRRVVRALEVIELTGRPFSATMPSREYLWPTVAVGLAVPRPVLDERIEQRVRRMWHTGLLEEVRGLEPRGLREGRTASRAIGYAQALAELDGDLTAEEAQQQTAALTRRLARRQESWFRPDPRVTWLDPRDHDTLARTVHLVRQAIRDNGRHG